MRWSLTPPFHPYLDVRRFRGFGQAARIAALPPRLRPQGLAARSEYRTGEVPRYWFSDPTVPLAVSSAVWFSVRRAALETVKKPVRPLVELGLPPSLTQSDLAARPQPCGTSHGLHFPTAHQGAEVHMPRGLPGTRYVPPAGFGYPLGGLLPPRPCRPSFMPAALMGFALRSFLLTEGTRPVSGRMNPRTVSPVGFPAARAEGRPNGPRFLGFDPSGSPWRQPQG
jgi:hypothetical protein